MSCTLDLALSEAARRRESLVAAAKAGALAGIGAGPSLAYAGMATGAAGPYVRQPTMQAHVEQYRHNNSWPHACIDATAKRLCGQPVRVARLNKPGGKARGKPRRPKKDTLPECFKDFSEDLDVLPGHPFLDLLQRPNGVMQRFQLTYCMVFNLELTGKSHLWLKVSEGIDDPAEKGKLEIWPVPSSWIKPIHSERRLFDGWEFWPGGNSAGQVTLERLAIGYTYYPDPANPLGSTSPLMAQARSVVADEHLQEAQRRTFTNGIFPGYAIIAGRHPDLQGKPGERPYLTREQRSQMINAIKMAYRGVLSYDEPIILDALINDIKRISNSPREMDFMQSGKLTKERIVQGFNTNPIVLGQVEGANRASASVADDNFVAIKVNPLIELISQSWTAWLREVFEDAEDLLFYLEPAKAKDPDYEMSEEKALSSQGAITVNEVRKRHGLPPLEPHVGDVVYMPQAMVAVPVTDEAAKAIEKRKPEPPPPPPMPPPAGGGQGNAQQQQGQGGKPPPAQGGQQQGGQAKPGSEDNIDQEGGAGGKRAGHSFRVPATWPYGERKRARA